MAESSTLKAEREETARHFGFNSYAELLVVSSPMPMLPGEVVQGYLAHHPRGHWFTWDDVPERGDASSS
jgi:hypothetical protein